MKSVQLLYDNLVSTHEKDLKTKEELENAILSELCFIKSKSDVQTSTIHNSHNSFTIDVSFSNPSKLISLRFSNVYKIVGEIIFNFTLIITYGSGKTIEVFIAPCDRMEKLERYLAAILYLFYYCKKDIPSSYDAIEVFDMLESYINHMK